MNTEEDETVVEETEGALGIEQSVEDQDGGELSPEDLARKMGWRPKEEFRGKPETWEDAETFLKKAEEDYPRKSAANARLEAEVKKMSRQIDAMREHSERVAQETERRTREKVLEELNQKHLTAVAEGDVNEAHRIVLERDKVVAPPQQQQSPRDRAVIEAWAEENQWYNDDPMMAEAAVKYEDLLAKRGVPLAERLKQTTEYVKRKFPNDFNPVRKPAQAPQGVVGSRNGVVHTTKPKAGSYEALTRDAKRKCDDFVASMKADGKSEQVARATYLQYATQDMFQA